MPRRSYTAALKKVAEDRNLVMRENKAKGDCMFVALSQQMENVLKLDVDHVELRRKLVEYLRKHPITPNQTHQEEFLVDESWEKYLDRMQQDGEWGDNLILQAAANVYKMKILLIMTTGEEATIEPHIKQRSFPKLVLGFDPEKHYVSLEPKEDMASYKPGHQTSERRASSFVNSQGHMKPDHQHRHATSSDMLNIMQPNRHSYHGSSPSRSEGIADNQCQNISQTLNFPKASANAQTVVLEAKNKIKVVQGSRNLQNYHDTVSHQDRKQHQGSHHEDLHTHGAAGYAVRAEAAVPDTDDDQHFVTQHGIHIFLLVGNIVDVKANAVVTGEDTELKHPSMVTKYLYRLGKGGEEFKHQRSNMQKRNKFGAFSDVLVSSMNHFKEFPFQYVLHAILAAYDHRQHEQWMNKMSATYRNIFLKCDLHCVMTVTLPFLGTGRGGADIAGAIEIAVKSIADYSSTSLKKVYFVSFETYMNEFAVTCCTRHLLRKFDGSSANNKMPREPRPGYEPNNYLSGRPKQRNRDSNVKHGNIVSLGKYDEKQGPGNKLGSVKYTESVMAQMIGGRQSRTDRKTYDGKSQSLDVFSDSEKEMCPICMDVITNTKELDKCGHRFCRKCIEDSFKHFKTVCPICQTMYGVLTGNMPQGTMTTREEAYPSLPGYEGCGMITIDYNFPDGRQTHEHPHPGRQYFGRCRTAYLPRNKKGQTVLDLLKLAFHRRLTFTIGRSMTTGRDEVIWSVDHKTNVNGGSLRNGYPDDTYLSRVKEELASKGVTEDQLTDNRDVCSRKNLSV